jgi:hypothetical protein
MKVLLINLQKNKIFLAPYNSIRNGYKHMYFCIVLYMMKTPYLANKKQLLE